VLDVSRELLPGEFSDGCENIPERSVITNAYLVAGALPCPCRTLLVPYPSGLQLLTHSSVPLGTGQHSQVAPLRGNIFWGLS